MFPLLTGLFFAPFQTRADLISSLFGVNASADSLVNPNSQSMPLLQANVSSLSILSDKDKKVDDLSNKTEVNIVADNALLPATSSMGALSGILDTDSFSDDVSVYVIRKGDSIAQIAQMFDVTVNTILWANDMKKGDALKEGEVLLILPVSGVNHTVLKGQTLKGIANKYNVEAVDIARFNGIAEDAELAVGSELVIPDGEVMDTSSTSTKTNTKTTTNTKNKSSVNKYSGKALTGYFINPVPGSIRTQGLHGKNSIDLGAPIGTPIYASAGGKVLIARYGWNGAYGNMILIQHENGTQTLYSHLSSISTKTGARVDRGELIGKVGNTGRVRAGPGGNGSHLHFEVHGAKNPGVDGSWAKLK